MDRLRADIANKHADAAYERGLLAYEPWKVMVAGLAAGAGLMAAATALATVVLRSVGAR